MLRICLAALFLMACCAQAILADEPDVAARAAIEAYLRQVEEIDRHAADAKAAAKQKLLDALGRRAVKAGDGLIGTATINGERTSIAFQYQHGRVFSEQLVHDRFHKTDAPRPPLSITLLGSVEVPREMTIKVWHAAGGVSEDHGELHVGERLLGRVGDDLVKKAIYTLRLPEGKHSVRWVLTGGYFRNNLLKFEDAETGKLLYVSHDASHRTETGADKAGEVVSADADLETWPEATDPKQWLEQPLAD